MILLQKKGNSLPYFNEKIIIKHLTTIVHQKEEIVFNTLIFKHLENTNFKNKKGSKYFPYFRFILSQKMINLTFDFQ